MDIHDIPFLIKDVRNEMPLFSDDVIKIKCSFTRGMPKDFNDYSNKVNEKFLDNHLATVEDFSLKFPNTELIQWFKEYQNRYFSAKIKDSFLRIDEDGNFGTVRNYRPMSIQNVGFLGSLTSKILGATLETSDGSTASTGSMANEVLHLNLLPNATIGDYYDRIAQRLSATTGNLKHAVYSDSTPAARKAVTGSIGAYSTYAFQSVTEFQISAVVNWAATIDDSTTEYTQYYYKNQVSGDGKYNAAVAFSTGPPDPAPALTNHPVVFQMKIGHS